MNWRLKAAIQRALSAVPFGGEVNYRLQRVARRSPAFEDSDFRFHVRLAKSQLESAVAALGRPASSLARYEFGAGSHLIGPLTMRALGVPAQTIVDQDVLLRPMLVSEALARFERFGAELGLQPLPSIDTGSRKRVIDDLLRAGIEYRAPLDARATGLPAASFDLITSNSTLEHVPRTDLAPLVTECMRILKPDGVMSFRIDYEDHYAILDRELSPYNFLRYSERAWRKYNSRLHYQNRRRHSDYLKLFRSLDLDTISVETLDPSAEALAELARLPRADEFKAYELPDLAVRKGTFLLRKQRA